MSPTPRTANKTTTIITPANDGDVAIIAELAQRIWPVAYGPILSEEQISNLLGAIYNHDNLRNEMQGGHRFWLALADGVPVGFASAYLQDHVMWLRKLYVLPKAQGCGIGKQLLHRLYAAFPEAGEARLLVNTNNRPAQQFYERMGFCAIDEVPVKMGDFSFIDLVFSRALS